METKTLAVTSRENGDEGKISMDDFIERILDEDKTRYNYHETLKQRAKEEAK